MITIADLWHCTASSFKLHTQDIMAGQQATQDQFRGEKEARSEQARTASKSVAKLDNLLFGLLNIDELAYKRDGSHPGTRQRPIDPNRPTIGKLLQSGFDATTASGFIVFEAVFSKAEWAAMVANKDLPDCPAEPPQPLHSMFPTWNTRKKYDQLQRIDASNPDLQFKWRRFYVIDGNHRVWTMQEVKAGRLHYKDKVTQSLPSLPTI